MDDNTNIMITNLAKKGQQLQLQINKKKEAIRSQQEKIGRLEEQVQDIHADIAKLKLRDAKEAEKKKPTDNPMDVEESDAAITTGALDGASQSSGGAGQSGWRYYSKIGDVLRRSTPSKKKKKIDEFMDSFGESVEDGEQ